MSFPREPLTTSELMTYQDAVERLSIASGSRGTGTELNAMRMSIQDALRELPGKHDWAYYKRAIQVTTVPNEAGKIGEYDHTGGAHERQLTLTTGTWNANAAEGQVIMVDNLFRVEKRISDTVVQLSVDSNPGRDLSSRGVNWVQTAYSLGQRIRRLLYLAEAENDVPLDYVSQAELMQHLRNTPQPSTPILYNIHNSGGYLATMELEFAPPPLDARGYIIAIEAQPRPIRTHKDHFTVTTSGATVTSTDNAFKSYHLGAVIRLSSSAEKPTGSGGDGADYNPFVEQRIITSVNSVTEVTVSGAFDRNWTGVAAVVTDPLDLDPTSLWDYFFALCRRKFTQYSPAGGKLDEAFAMEKRAFMQAVSNNPYIHADTISQAKISAVPGMDFILEFPTTG